MSLTITINEAVPATLTVSVGTPGATGPAGAAGATGAGVASGGTTGQYLVKTSNADFATGWSTLSLSGYALESWVTSYFYPRTGNPDSFATQAWVTGQNYLTIGSLASYATQAWVNNELTIYAAQSWVTGQGYITASALSPYLLSSTAATTYAPIAAGLPTGGTVGQVLTKNSGTNFDASFATLIPGDRYLTTSTTSNTIGNGAKTFTVGTGLSYTPTQDVTISYDASKHMHAEVTTYNSGTGVLVVDVKNHTGSGTYAAWTVNVGGVTPLASVAWGAITGTLGDQTDLATALNNKLEVSTAASTYYPLAGNPSSFLVAADITGKANLASPAFTGNVTINSSTGAALFIEQTGTGNILTLHDQASDTSFVSIDANGKINVVPSTTAGAGFNIATATAAPTSPVDGDIWTTNSGVFARINGTTQQLMNIGNTQQVTGSITFSNSFQTLGNSVSTGTINVASGATISGATKNVNVATGGVVGSTTTTTVGPVLGASTTSIGNTTAASTLNLATGATLTATTKAVNIGTSGVAGSTTNIAIGSTTGTSTTTLQGTTNGITAAADTNSVALATTAFVVGQASSTTPAATGTADVGTSLKYARADHVHLNPLPTGGTTGQVLSKVDGTSYNVAWTTPIGDAPSDGSVYGRLNGTWAIPPPGVPEAPNDGLLYARNNLGWAAIFGDAPSNGYNYGRYNGSWAIIDPPYTNSVWAYGHWTSANVTMLYDSVTMMYYNVLTF